jgi:hypothetical protein
VRGLKYKAFILDRAVELQFYGKGIQMKIRRHTNLESMKIFIPVILAVRLLVAIPFINFFTAKDREGGQTREVYKIIITLGLYKIDGIV